MTDLPIVYVSVIGISYLQPIADLFSKLTENSTKNEVQTSTCENGYSVSIILLTIMMLESFIARTRYVVSSDNIDGDEKKSRSVVSFFGKQFDNPEMTEMIFELFVIRDVIAHNHLWEAEIINNREYKLKFYEDPLLNQDLFGDRKYISVVDFKKRRTKQLGLNVFPTRINRDDAVKVLDKTYEVLGFLEDQDRRYCYVRHNSIEYKGEYITFNRFIEIVNTYKFNL